MAQHIEWRGPGGESAGQYFPRTLPIDARGQRKSFCIVIDAEEDFDWRMPGRGTAYSTDCMRKAVQVEELTAGLGIKPAYLLTYPVLEDETVVRILRGQHERGTCELGIQLHPWVTPPFDDAEGAASYLGTIGAVQEERKLTALIERFRQCFGFSPVLFRAGRYGLSAATARLLEAHGIAVDTSVAPRTDFQAGGGPDFSAFDADPFWFGAGRPILEVPLCRAIIGWGGRAAPALYRAAGQKRYAGFRLRSVLSRFRMAERITLSPEGNDFGAMKRLLRGRSRHGQTVFSLSFHSSSLAPGLNPYVRDQASMHHFFDRMSAVIDAVAGEGFAFTSLGSLPGVLGMPAWPAQGAAA